MAQLKTIYDKKGALIGLFLLLLGIVTPLFINERSFNIYLSLDKALWQGNPTELFFGASKLVMMNCIRALPHYMGAFVISEYVSLSWRGKKLYPLNALFAFALILGVYRIIDMVYPIKYDFGIPAVLIVLFILSLSYMDLFSVSWINKLIILLSLLMSIQWLDIVPFLTDKGFGRGEISLDVKTVSVFLGYDGILAWYAISMFMAFMVCSAIQVQILYKEHRLQITTLKNLQVEKELVNAQINALRMRSFGEVQSLVHDLKTPLTTILGLVSLSEMQEKDDKIKDYLGKIANSVGNMSILISEILYEDKRNTFPLAELIKSVLSQISISIPGERLEKNICCPDAYIFGNRIHLSRAIINPINNAWQAVDKEAGIIKLDACRKDGNIVIEIYDNGKGIPDSSIDSIWEPGFSGNHSTGLGLSFTKQVIENHGGTIEVESEKGVYTRIIMRLKEVYVDEG